MTIVEQANIEKRPVLLAKTQDIDALRSAGVTEADIEWIHDNELPDSRLVVATTTGGMDAWWSVRPNGTAVLRANGGRGQAHNEYIFTSDVIVTFVCGMEVGELIGDNLWKKGGSEEGAWIGAFECVALGGAGKLMGLGVVGHAKEYVEVFYIGLDILMHFFIKGMYE
jgi:hypothetical protein